MLSRKQIWRRMKAPYMNEMQKYAYDNEQKYGSLLRVKCVNDLSRISSYDTEASFTTTSDDSEYDLDGEFISDNQNKISNKSVVFDEVVKVVLIPTKQEYEDASLGDLMWWRKSDYCSFRQSAGLEIKFLKEIAEISDIKDIMRHLYQPGCEIESDLFETHF